MLSSRSIRLLAGAKIRPNRFVDAKPRDRHHRNNPTNRIVRNNHLAPTEMGHGSEFGLLAPLKEWFRK
jgi:hypothetical protein